MSSDSHNWSGGPRAHAGAEAVGSAVNAKLGYTSYPRGMNQGQGQDLDKQDTKLKGAASRRSCMILRMDLGTGQLP